MQVLQFEGVRADLEHLGDVEVGRDGQLLRERRAVHQLDGREDRRALLVRLDLLDRGHEATGAGREHALEAAQRVARECPRRPSSPSPTAMLLLLLLLLLLLSGALGGGGAGPPTPPPGLLTDSTRH